MKNYVLVFVMNQALTRVLLIRKAKRPVQHIGSLNGVGGKIEEGEMDLEAAIRETREETTLEIEPKKFKLFCTLQGNHFRVGCYVVTAEFTPHYSSVTEEGLVSSMYIDTLIGNRNVAMVPNVRWLLPMAVDAMEDENFKEAIIEYTG